jgi:hypothetical protein
MKRILYFLLISFNLLLLSYPAQSQPDSSMNKKTFRVWVKSYNSSRLTEGILYDVKDSSIRILLTNPISIQKTKERLTTMDVKSIEVIRLRKKGSIGKGVLIGGLTGAAIGTLLSLSFANSVHDNSVLYVIPAMFAGLGVAIGFIAGGVKIKMPIYGNQDNFNLYRKELNGFAKYRTY